MLQVTDFGMGWMRESDSDTDMMTSPCGTPKYMPPELLSHRGEGYCGKKIDVWSCGMVLFACLAGYLPYTGDTGDSTAILEQITRSGSIQFPEWFSEGACDVLTKALEKDPSKRIDMKGLRDHEWTRAGAGTQRMEISANLAPAAAHGSTLGVPSIQLDGSFGLRALEFSSPVTPGGMPFAGAHEETPSGLCEQMNMWEL